MRLNAFYFFAIAAVILVVAAAKEATAAGFAVSPLNLEFAIEKGLQAQRQLIIYNTAEEPAEFSAASSNPQAIAVSPATGTINSQGKAVITATAKGTKPGLNSGEIVIGLSSHDSSKTDVSLSLGTAVPVKISVAKGTALAANALFGMMLSAGIVLMGTVVYYAARRRARRLSTGFCSAYDLYLQKSR